MKNYNRLLDTSKELIITPHGCGIKLTQPTLSGSLQNGSFQQYSIGAALQLPFNVFFLNADSGIQNINEVNISYLRIDSVERAKGQSVLGILEAEAAKRIIDNDIAVIASNNKKIIEEHFVFDDEDLCMLSIKVPWYDQKNKVVGIFGCAVSLKEHSLASSLNEIAQLGLLSPQKIAPYINNNYHLPKREKEILHHVIRGQSARQIGARLSISPRTVEKHIVNLKFKMNVQSKSELIEKILEKN